MERRNDGLKLNKIAYFGFSTMFVSHINPYRILLEKLAEEYGVDAYIHGNIPPFDVKGVQRIQLKNMNDEIIPAKNSADLANSIMEFSLEAVPEIEELWKSQNYTPQVI